MGEPELMTSYSEGIRSHEEFDPEVDELSFISFSLAAHCPILNYFREINCTVIFRRHFWSFCYFILAALVQYSGERPSAMFLWQWYLWR